MNVLAAMARAQGAIRECLAQAKSCAWIGSQEKSKVPI